MKLWRERAAQQQAATQPKSSAPEAGSSSDSDADDLPAGGTWFPPSAPRMVTSRKTSITVSWWTDVRKPQRYELQYAPVDGDTSTPKDSDWRSASSTVRQMRLTVENLCVGSNYKFRVRLRKGSLWSPYSLPSLMMSTLPAAPVTSTAPQCSAASTTSITVKWTPPAVDGGGTLRYSVLCGELGTASDRDRALAVMVSGTVEAVVIYSGEDLGCTAVNLKPHTLYVFRVVASNDDGATNTSPPTLAATATPDSSKPIREIDGGWQEWWDKTHERYYYISQASGETAWELPAYLNRLMRRFGEWAEYWDVASQHIFYFNTVTQERAWDPPTTFTVGAGDVLESDNTTEVGANTAGTALSVDGNRNATLVTSTSAAPFAGHMSGSGVVVAATSTGALSEEDIAFRQLRFGLLFAARDVTVEPGSVSVGIRRDHIVEDSFDALRRLAGPQLQRTLEVKFTGEAGVDGGGLTKDWCLSFSRALLDDKLRLFRETAAGDGRVDVHPGACTPTGVELMRLVGRFLGKAVFDRQLVELHLCTPLCVHLVGKQPTLEDLTDADPELCNGLQWVLNNDITDVIDATFSVVRQDGSDTAGVEEVELIPDGANVEVTEANKREYVARMVAWRGGEEAKDAIGALVAGFHEVLPASHLKAFSPDHLRSLLTGRVTVDVSAMAATSMYTDGMAVDTPVAMWFWEVLGEADTAARQRVLKFVTGTDKVPLDGFEPPFTITLSSDRSVEDFPRAHTCFNQLLLPPYTTKEDLTTKLWYAVDNTEGFGLS